MATHLNATIFNVIIWIILLGLPNTRCVNGLIAYDCGHDRVNLTAVSLVSIGTCQFKADNIEKDEDDIQLLQISEVSPIHIYQCKINVIQSVYKCGMFSHVSIVSGGLSSFIVEVGRDACMNIHIYGTYKLQNGRIIANIKSNSSTTHTETVAGSIDQNGACQGAPYTSGIHSWNDVVVIQAIEFTIADYTNVVRLEDNQVILRNDITCAYLNGRCMDIDNGLSFWDMFSDTSCEALKYDVIWQGKATKVRHVGNSSIPIHSIVYTVNAEDTVFALEVKKPISVCRFSGYQTEHPRLVIVPKAASEYWFTKKAVSTKNLDLFAYVNSKFVYTERHIRMQVEKLYLNVLLKKCELERDVLQTQISIASHHPAEFAYMRMKEPGYTAVPRGELIYMIKCQPVEVTIRKVERCFLELPIMYNNNSHFMTPNTHLIQQHGTEIPCSSLMSPGYLINGEWYGLNPFIHRLKHPNELKPSNEAGWSYEDPGNLIKAGIYSMESMEKLRRQIMYPSERQAISNILTQRMLGANVDSQNVNVLHLLTTDSMNHLAESLKLKIWGAFSWLGNISAGVLGIYVAATAIKYIVDTIINAKILKSAYGWSWSLIAATCSSITNWLMHRHNKSQTRGPDIELTSVTTQGTTTSPTASDPNKEEIYATVSSLTKAKAKLYPQI